MKSEAKFLFAAAAVLSAFGFGEAAPAPEAEWVNGFEPALVALIEKHNASIYESPCEAVESGVRMRKVKRVVFLSSGGVPGRVIEKSEKCWIS